MCWCLENGATAAERDIERETGIRERSKFMHDGESDALKRIYHGKKDFTHSFEKK